MLVESGLLTGSAPGLGRARDEHDRPDRRRGARSRGPAARLSTLLDAPVSGSVSVAEAAQLFAMVGGDREAYELATPVLDAMTKGHMLLGPSGAGAAMKLAVNAMIAVTNESLAETLALAEVFGIPRERAYDVLAGGALASPLRPLQAGRIPPSRDGAGRVHDRADAEGRRARPGSRRPSRRPHPGRRRGCGRARRGARQRSRRCRHGVGDQPSPAGRPAAGPHARHDDTTEEP